MPAGCQFFDTESVTEVQKKLKNKKQVNDGLLAEHAQFKIVLENRRKAFTNAAFTALQNKNKSLAKKFLRAAILFEEFIEDCIKNPQQLRNNLEAYYQSKDYIHAYYDAQDFTLRLKSEENVNNYSDLDAHAKLSMGLAAVLAIGTLFAIVFAPATPIPYALGTLMFTLLIPALYYHFAVTMENQNLVKAQEKEVFRAFNKAFPLSQRFESDSESEEVFSDENTFGY